MHTHIHRQTERHTVEETLVPIFLQVYAHTPHELRVLELTRSLRRAKKKRHVGRRLLSSFCSTSVFLSMSPDLCPGLSVCPSISLCPSQGKKTKKRDAFFGTMSNEDRFDADVVSSNERRDILCRRKGAAVGVGREGGVEEKNITHRCKQKTKETTRDAHSSPLS